MFFYWEHPERQGLYFILSSVYEVIFKQAYFYRHSNAKPWSGKPVQTCEALLP